MNRLATAALVLGGAALSHACWSPPRDEGPAQGTHASSPSWAIVGGLARVEPDGLHLEGHGWTVSLTTRGIGRSTPAPLGDAQLSRDDQHAVLERDGLSEWFVRLPTAIEHGYTIAERPPGKGPLEVLLAVEGLGVTSRQGHVQLVDATGDVRLGYGGLTVTDAAGARVPARLEARGDGIAIVVDDRHATYPVTVDPIVFAPQASLSPIAPESPFYFGRGVAIQGTTCVATDYGEGAVDGQGAVFVYEQVGGVWMPDIKLEMPVEANGNLLGFDVDMSGDSIVAGAPGADGAANDHGAAVVFVNAGGWTFQAQLMAPDGGLNDDLGTSVGIHGDTVVAGAPNDDDVANNAGAAYVFVRSGTTWSFEDKLIAPDGAVNDTAGRSVDVDGDTAVVGAQARNGVVGPDSGGVYVFERSGTQWGAPQLLEAPTPSSGGRFGETLDLDGDSLVIGEPGWMSNAGRAHVFVRQGATWTWQATLEPVLDASTFAGDAVAIHGDRVLVGAHGDFLGGSVFLYERAGMTWSLTDTLKEPTPVLGNDFGYAVAIDGDRLAAGAAAGDTAGNNLGAAYAFALTGQPCLDDTTCTTGLCVDGFCCIEACDQGCGRCDAPGSEGLCTPVGMGLPAGPECPGFACDGGTGCPSPCSDDLDCAPGFFCDGTGDCLPVGDLGDPCAIDSGCASGQCADGLCCDAACDAACESCAESGSEGTCVLVTGEPRSGHPSCPADACAEGILESDFACDGTGTACVPTVTPCEPYACGEGACLNSCLSDGQCAPDFNCLVAQQICVPSDPICDGVDTLLLPDGGTEACRPYRCTEAGACRTACAFTGDCSPGFVCGSDGRCVAPPPPRSPASCAIGGGDPASWSASWGAWWLLGGLGLLMGRRRSFHL